MLGHAFALYSLHWLRLAESTAASYWPCPLVAIARAHESKQLAPSATDLQSASLVHARFASITLWMDSRAAVRNPAHESAVAPHPTYETMSARIGQKVTAFVPSAYPTCACWRSPRSEHNGTDAPTDFDFPGNIRLHRTKYVRL